MVEPNDAQLDVILVLDANEPSSGALYGVSGSKENSASADSAVITASK